MGYSPRFFVSWPHCSVGGAWKKEKWRLVPEWVAATSCFLCQADEVTQKQPIESLNGVRNVGVMQNFCNFADCLPRLTSKFLHPHPFGSGF